MNSTDTLFYDIESMYIDGMSARRIAQILECSIETVFAVLEEMSVTDTPDTGTTQPEFA